MKINIFNYAISIVLGSFTFAQINFAIASENPIKKQDELISASESPLDRNLSLPNIEDLEYLQSDENLEKIVAQMFQSIVKKGQVSRPGEARAAKRGAHAKHHGCAVGKFIIEKGLPKVFRKGVFAREIEYKAFVRFSNGTSEIKSDLIPDSHGMAIKLLGINAQLLDDYEANGEKNTQDFIMIDTPIFFLRKAEDYISVMTASARGPEGLKEWMKSHPYEAVILTQSLKEMKISPLGSQFWSQTPYKLGANNAMKFTAKPCAKENFSDLPVKNAVNDNYLKEGLAQYLAKENACYEFFVIPQRDKKTMPIEDSTIEWPTQWNGQKNIFKLATLLLPKGQVSNSDLSMQYCEDMSFTPWHGTEDLKPLGEVNLVRKYVYSELSKFRLHLNNLTQLLPSEEIWQKLMGQRKNTVEKE